MSTTNQTSETDAGVQGNLLREYEHRFADLSEHVQLTKPCSAAVLAKTVEKGQYFATLDDNQFDRLKGSCREYTLPRSDQSSQVKGWIRGNTKIGPVLDVMVCYHQGRYGFEIKIESIFGDKTCSWVRIVNGINKYVAETSEEIHIESVGEKSTGKLVAKARPRQTSNLTLSPVSIPYRERKWIDMEPGRFDKSCPEVLTLMIRLLRHDDSIYRQEDGEARFEDLASTFRSRNESTSRWSIRTCVSVLKIGRGPKKRLQYCSEPQTHLNIFCTFEQFKAILEGALVDPTLQDNVLLPDDFIEHSYHVGNSHDLHYHPVWADSGR